MSVIWTFFFGTIPYNTGTKYFKYNSLVTNIQKTLGFAGHYECDLDFFSLVPFHTTQAQNIQKTLGFAGHYECDLDFFSLVPFHITQAQNTLSIEYMTVSFIHRPSRNRLGHLSTVPNQVLKYN